MTTAPLLSVRGLAKHYQTRSATLKILDNISFDIAKGGVVLPLPASPTTPTPSPVAMSREMLPWIFASALRGW